MQSKKVQVLAKRPPLAEVKEKRSVGHSFKTTPSADRAINDIRNYYLPAKSVSDTIHMLVLRGIKTTERLHQVATENGYTPRW